MIVIDMDMPKCCGACNMSGTGVCKEWMNLKGYDMGQKRADTCPIKCDINDIKAEIEQIEINGYIRDVECFRAGINTTLNVIDKYKTGGKDKE